MEYCNENYTNNIPNVTQQKEALGDWIYLGYVGGFTSFVLLVLYIANVFVNIMKNPPWTRRYIAWITSLPMVVSFLSLSSFFVPRATVMCEAIKFTYMPFILMLFVEVTLFIGGGEKMILDELLSRNVQWYWFTLPFCGSLKFSSFAVTKKSLRVISALVYQAFVAPFCLTIIMAILESAEVLRSDHYDWIFWMINILNVVYVASFAAGSWALFILVTGINAHLESKWPNFTWKYYALVCFVALQKGQNFVFSFLTFINITSTVVGKTIDAALSMFEALISGVLYFFVFRVSVEYHRDETNPHTHVAAEPAAKPLIAPPTANDLLNANQTCHNSLP